MVYWAMPTYAERLAESRARRIAARGKPQPKPEPTGGTYAERLERSRARRAAAKPAPAPTAQAKPEGVDFEWHTEGHQPEGAPHPSES